MNLDFLTIDQISSLYPLAGVYELYKYNNGILELVYIGKTWDGKGRLMSHRLGKHFDYFKFEYLPRSIIDKIEFERLEKYSQAHGGQLPKYNKQSGNRS